MSFLIQSIKKDLQRKSRDPWSVAIWVGIPFLIGVLFTFIMGGGSGPQPTAQLLIADEDQSLVSSLLVGSFSQEPLSELVEVTTVETEEGRQLMEEGDASALLIISGGFGEAVVSANVFELELVKNPSQSILPSIIEEIISLWVDAIFYFQQIFPEELELLAQFLRPDAGQAPSDEDIASLSISINQAMQRIGQYAFPPVISVEIEEPETQTEAVSLGFLFFPGVLLMALVMGAQSMSVDFWKERELGTLRRLTSARQNFHIFLLGKLGACAILFLAVFTVLLLVGFSYHGVDLSKLPVSLLILTLGSLTFWLLLSLIQMFMSSLRSASILTGALIFPLMMTGGSFFPFETMPSWMRAIGEWTPNGIVLTQLKEHLLQTGELGSLLFVLGGLGLVGFMLFMACSMRLEQAFGKA